MKVRTIAFSTLGCKLNQYETDSLASQFHRAGYQITDFDADTPADAYVINTCTVTNKSDRKSRNIINRATGIAGGAATKAGADTADAGTAKPVVVVTGCYVDSARNYLGTRDDITYLVDNRRKSRIFHIVDAHFRGEVVDPNAVGPDLFSYQVADHGFHTRGMVKIQDGCDNFCTFCIIPYVRGRATSRPLADITENVRRLVESGAKEVVLTGVNMGRYRDQRDGGERDFCDVIEGVLNISGDFRVRLSSLEPEPLGERFVELLGHPKMCPHLHLCLQSGSDRVLLQMRRMYSVEQYLSMVDRIRRAYDRFNFTTDVIVGFPGESDADFALTRGVCEDVGFSHIHTFKYSRRSGTRADRMDGQIAEPLKAERSEEIRAISERNKRGYRSRLIGGRERVLVERIEHRPQAPGASGGRLRLGSGYGAHYTPIRFPMDGAPGTLNEFLDVDIYSIEAGEDPALLGIRAG